MKQSREELNRKQIEYRHRRGISIKYNSYLSHTKPYRKVCRQKRKALLKYSGKLPMARIQLVYEDNIKRYGTLTCIYCKEPIQFGKDTLEHIVPCGKGGTNEYSNLAIACKSCNSRKNCKTVQEYRLYLKKLGVE